MKNCLTLLIFEIEVYTDRPIAMPKWAKIFQEVAWFDGRIRVCTASCPFSAVLFDRCETVNIRQEWILFLIFSVDGFSMLLLCFAFFFFVTLLWYILRFVCSFQLHRRTLICAVLKANEALFVIVPFSSENLPVCGNRLLQNGVQPKSKVMRSVALL